MRSFLFVPILALFVLAGCGRESHTIVGTWKVVHVNVDFDEYRYTPDMVKQVGLAEKSNVLIVTPDSTMLYISCGDTLRGKISVLNSELFINNEKFATYKNDTVTEVKRTVLGDVEIKYTKQ